MYATFVEKELVSLTINILTTISLSDYTKSVTPIQYVCLFVHRNGYVSVIYLSDCLSVFLRNHGLCPLITSTSALNNKLLNNIRKNVRNTQITEIDRKSSIREAHDPLDDIS